MLNSFYKATTVTLITLITVACSSDNRYKREVNGNESYLDTPKLERIVAPEGMVLPVPSSEYSITPVNEKGKVGKQLDIRPPEQPFSALEGSTSEYRLGTAILLSKEDGYSWQDVLNALNSKGFNYQSTGSNAVLTDLMTWNRVDENEQYQARYEIYLSKQHGRNNLVVKLVDLQLQSDPDTTVEPINVQRYTLMMFNEITLELAKKEHLLYALENQQTLGKNIVVEAGTDENNLPIVILRANYNSSWERLPATLTYLGFNIASQDRAKGEIVIENKGISKDNLAELGIQKLPLDQKKYTLRLGDLINRTTLQLTSDSKNEFLTEEQNNLFAPILQAALKQTNVK